MTDKKIKVLVVEDSNVVQMLLVHILNADLQLQVIGTAKNGREALQFLVEASVDVILMDIQMPEMDGFEATRRIMETQPVPIVICSGRADAQETTTAFRLMEVGAVAFVEKPFGREQDDFDAMVSHLVQTVKLMSEVKVVRRWPRTQRSGMTSDRMSPLLLKRTPNNVDVIGIGASTGGPPVLQTILTGLPKEFSAPLLIVQHIAPGFLNGLVEWLNQTTTLNVQIASHGIRPLPGHVYLAPDDFHMAVEGGGQIVLNKEKSENGLRPSVSHLFRSLAKVRGANAIGVLLTGMGKDGAEELKLMKDRGAVTIVQDRETSVIYGMPGEAVILGADTYVLPADKIASTLVAAVNQKSLEDRSDGSY